MIRFMMILLAALLLATGCSPLKKNAGRPPVNNALLAGKAYKKDRFSCLAQAAESAATVNNSTIQSGYRKCMFDRGYTKAELRATTSPYL